MKSVPISNQTIKSLVNSVASGSKIFLWDRELKGFGVYKTSAGLATFVYRYRFGAIIRSKTLGTVAEMTAAQARDLAREYAYRKRKGTDPVQEERDRLAEEKADEALLLGNFAEDYIGRRDRSDKPLTDDVISTIRTQILPPLGHIRIDRLTLQQVEDAGLALQKERGHSGRWFYTYVKQMMNDAERRNVIAKSPLKALVVPQPNERDRVLSEAELRLVLIAARDMGDARGDMIEMLVRMPKRKQEVVEMPWEEVDGPQRRWVIPADRTKNRERDTLILPRQVWALLERQQPNPSARSGRLFAGGGGTNPTLSGSARHMLDGCMHRRIELARAAGETVPAIEHFTLHDLRTAVATTLQKKPFSVPPHVLEAMLNHKVPSKVQRTYQRDKYVEEVGQALGAWNDHLDVVIGDPDGWPGGARLPVIRNAEAKRRSAILRKGWPKRSRSEDAD